MIDKVDGRSLRSGFLANAIATPDAPALVIQGTTRTYAELDSTARTWAAGICDALGRAPERVGVFGYRSEVSHTGVLAALLSGAAFVPLNRTFPPERTRAMIDAANLDAIIVDRDSAPQLATILPASWPGAASCPPGGAGRTPRPSLMEWCSENANSLGSCH